MKRKTAKEILAESFRELAAGKSIDRITVREIAENCGYSSATFYRQFKDKYDLIAWDYTRKVEMIMSRIGEDEYSWQDTLIDAAYYFQEQRGYLANLFLHTRGLDSFVFNMIEINFRALMECVQKVSGTEELDEKTEMYIRIYVLGTVQLSCEWILGKYKMTPEELAKVYENSLPAPLLQYLCQNERI